MKYFIIVLSLAVFVHAGISWYSIICTTAPDFTVYYYSTQRFIEGLPIYGNTGLFTGLGYPPQSLIFYLPFLLFSYQVAQAIWITISFALLPVIVVLTMRLLYRHPSWLSISLMSALFFLAFPTKFTLGMGQVNLVALSLLLLSFGIKKNYLAGLAFGLSVLVKPQLVFIGLLFLFYQKFRLLMWAVFINCLAVGITILVFGGNDVVRYLTVETKSLSAFVERGIYYNQGISGFLSRIFPDQIAGIGVQLMRLIIIIISFLALRDKKITFTDGGILSLLFVVLLLPVTWQHHFVFLFPVVAWAFIRVENFKQRLLLLASIILISWNIKQPEQVLILPRLVLSHGFFGMLVLWLLVLKLIK